MVKHAEDFKTIEMLGAVRRRGRPPTGNAKTAAQRKRDQRERDHVAVWRDTVSGDSHALDRVSVDGLVNAIRNALMGGMVEAQTHLLAEVKRRTCEIRDSHK